MAIDRRTRIRLETSRGPVAAAITLAAFFVVLLAAVITGAFVLRSSFDETRALRATQLAQTHLLSLQLSEETGIRGYAAVGDPAFLTPYISATAQFRSALAQLARTASRARVVNAATRVTQLAAINAQWQREIAEPLRRNREGASANALSLHGKILVDRFRAVDQTMRVEIARDADLAENRTTRTLQQIALGLFVAIFAIGVVILRSSRVQLRLQTQHERDRERQYALERSNRELRSIANALQSALLPESLPCSSVVCFDATYEPASETALVGGDWYDAVVLDDGRVLFSIGDVAGHGIASAVVMSRVRQAILALATQERDPARLLAGANRALWLQGVEIMVTAICGFFDPRTHAITYATAGHPAPMLYTPGNGAAMLPRHGMALGIERELPLPTKFTQTAVPNALLVLYTDGLLEYARDVDTAEARLLAAVDEFGRCGGDHPADAIRAGALAGAQPRDDIALLTARFTT